jgi:hypothetical protein
MERYMSRRAAGEKESLLRDAEKFRARREKARQGESARRAKLKEAGKVLVQAWTSRSFVKEARSEGYKPVIVWAKPDAKLPDTLFFLRAEQIQEGQSHGIGYIFGATATS